MSDIFLSYRRRDTASATGHLAERLQAHFGAARVFLDRASITAGEDFAAAIRRALASAVVLVVIGPDWLDARDERGQRRLDDPADMVRLEIEAAFERGLALVPVLVDGATMPSAAQLPPSLAALAGHQAFELSETRWAEDARRLVTLLQQRYGIESERPLKAGGFAPGWPGRLALDLLELASRPTRLIGRRQTGHTVDHLRAFGFLVACLAVGNTLLLIGLDHYMSWREAGRFIGFVLFTGTLELLAVALLAVPLALAWRLTGTRVELRQITLILAYIAGGAWLGFASGWLLLGLGVMLGDPTALDRATALLHSDAPLGERVQQADAVMSLALRGPAQSLLVTVCVIWAVTAAWAVVAWGAFRLAFDAGRLRAALATLLWLAQLAGLVALSAWLTD